MLARALKEFESNETRVEAVKRIVESLLEKYRDKTLDIKSPELEKRGGAYYSDAVCRLISSIYNDTRDIQPLNTMNKGAISGLPHDGAVEGSCVITKDGPVPLTTFELLVPV